MDKRINTCRDNGNIEAERRDFEEWAELTACQMQGSAHDVIGWYYFDEVTQDRWEAWQARATVACDKSPPATGETEDLPPLPEPAHEFWDYHRQQHIRSGGFNAEQYRQGQREAIAHYLRKQANNNP